MAKFLFNDKQILTTSTFLIYPITNFRESIEQQKKSGKTNCK